MNTLVVPPAPHWYRSSVMTCAPDNTVIYGAKNDIVILREKTPEEPLEVQMIHGAHVKHVISVSLNKKWGDPYSYIVSLGEENIIKVWNLQTLEKKTSNKDHLEHKDSLIGAVFAGDDRVVSASLHGHVFVWNVNTNESKPLKDLFKSKVTLTCLSSCPHAGWLLAFGLNDGCVIVADVRRNGHVLYRLRGHYQSVVSLTLCPAPINVFPRYVNNKVKNKSQISEKNDIVEVADQNYQAKTECLCSEEVHDFLKQCEELPNKISGLADKSENFFEKVPLEENPAEDVISSPELLEVEVTENTIEDSTEDKSRNDNIEVKDDYKEVKQKPEKEPEIAAAGDNVGSIQIDEATDVPRKVEVESEKDPEIDASGDHADNTKTNEPKCEIVEEEPRTEYLLASSGKDKNIYIWRAGTDGRMQTYFNISKQRNRKDKHLNTWISVCWVTPDTILTSSTSGEILLWPVPKPKESNKQFKIIHNEHSSLVFNIVSAPKSISAYNWRDKIDSNIWTWGQDGKLINYDLNAAKIRYCYSMMTAMVTCFGTSPLDPNRLAVSLRDGNIKVWDLSLPHTNIITMQKYQQKFTYKVSAISWHPVKEMILGFGTEEGRVGFIDLISKKTTLFPHYFQTQIYKIEWGPIKGDESNLGLYIVSEGKMAVYDLQQPTEDPLELELPKKLYVYKFAWKPDFTLLLLNGKDGSLVVLKTDLTAITTVYPNEKGLNGIVWHPDAFTDKIDISPRCNWFAATTTKGVLIFDCTSIDENDNFADKVVAVLEGHLRPPLALAWCPFEGNQIVSTAPDGLTHVWDVTTKSVVATFVDSYFSHNLSVVWSPIDADLIILGSKILRVWSVSENPPKVDEAARKRLLAKSSKLESDKIDKKNIKVDIPQKNKNIPKNCIVPAFYVSNDENISAQISTMRKLMNENFENDSKSLDPFQLFGNKEQVTNLLEINYAQQQKEGKHKSCEMISLWKGNIGENIRNAINENRVTPSLISLAPMVSPKLWQDACLSYAKKLSEEANSDPLETAMYFLACHKIEEAIDCLSQNCLFKEALALAKYRLPESSDIITKVVEEWAEHCTNTGNFENAAYCYISIKKYENAAKVLARRNNKEFLNFAVELAEKAGNKSLTDSINFKISEIQNSQGNNVDEFTEKNGLTRVDVLLQEISKEDLPSESDEDSQSHNDES